MHELRKYQDDNGKWWVTNDSSLHYAAINEENADLLLNNLNNFFGQSKCAYLDNLQGGDMQVAICFKNGDMFVLQTEQKTFSVGQKIVIERGDMFEIEDVQYQFRKTDSGLVQICTNLIIKEEA